MADRLPPYLDGLEDILTSLDDSFVLSIQINRPKARNALRTNLLKELADTLDKATHDDMVRAVVLTGGAKVFAAGADITEMADKTPVDVMNDPRSGYWMAIRNFPKPMIGAVNGFCLGGGNELAMHCDVLLAGTNAQFGQPEINLGIIPGAGGTQRLTQMIGKSKAMRMVLSGQFMSAHEAEKAGLVAEVCEPELTIDKAMALAKTIATKPPVAARLAKESVLKASDAMLAQGIAFERRSFATLFATQDKAEGVSAFMEKRKPTFKGQ
ncbi:enoyl-CoA hydratase-isomerase [Candidatus Terasakiella magnetica]|uniref:Enoyl-CoA hydratase-isomerase n=1 Tax=Candidatus Terasakiella magnetica TaxID=1867952 RepID=A0A1C3RE43_9PROT|nr:enoyl-CoA hydratase-related protein [Candidatus Terasakiella magnetica]SCA55502.1 enoyl-CoA hydratase-isomerase [Candidatus Terasakiella magnetica]